MRHRRILPFLAAVAIATIGLGAVAAAGTTLIVLSVDPYTNTSSYHRTEVEPDSFAFGSTIVDAFQVGRFTDAGSSNIGWATSTDGGATWTNGFLPGITKYGTPAGPYDSVSDPSVAYDAAHGVWLIHSLPINLPSTVTPETLVSRSTDGGLTWGPPIHVTGGSGNNFDKTWIACDDWQASPFYGRCYAEVDDLNAGNRLRLSTSVDGGLTWFDATAPNSSVIGGQPVAQPNGTVVVPIDNGSGSRVQSFVSTNGGASYSGPFTVATISEHGVAGGLRTSALLSAEVDAEGRVYVVWQDCRFRASCRSNDIVMSTSLDGQAWSAVVRIPIDAVGSTADHFLPGLGVDRGTAGGAAHLGLTFYYYPQASCSPSTCRLSVGFVSSTDGGATWTAPVPVAGPFKNTWLPNTSSGRMVGDYMSTSFSGGVAWPAFIGARSGSCVLGQVTSCRESALTVVGGLAAGLGRTVAVAADRPVALGQSDNRGVELQARR